MSLGEFNGKVAGVYHLNGNGNDSSGNARNVATAGTISWVNSVYDRGMSVAKGNNGLTLASNMGITGGACTLSLWYKPDAAPTSGYYGYMIVCADGGTSAGYDISYINVAGQVRLFYRRYIQNGGPGQENWIYYTYTLSTSQYTHVALTYDGSNIVRGFINGLRIASSTSNLGNGTGEASGFGLGLHRTGVQNSSGIYDEVIVEGRGWSNDEMLRYYNYAVGRYAPKMRF